MICPICASKKTAVILAADSFNIIACRSCDNAFTSPPPVIPEYENMDFHANVEKSDLGYIDDYRNLPYDWQQLISKQISVISSSLAKTSAVLEIGCGEGLLLHELQKLGFKNLLGYEPSLSAVGRAKKKGLPVINGYFDPAKVEALVDVVVMSHVFEHIDDPLFFLKQVSSVLKPEGYVMFTQTNYKGLIPRVQKKNWYAWVPDQHFWHFTPRGMKNIFSRSGFTVDALVYSSLIHPHDTLYKISKMKKGWEDQFIILAKKDS